MGTPRWLAAALLMAWTLPAPAQQADARAATERQSQHTDRANRDAAVPDEASGAASGARPARAGAGGNGPPPSYGPVLTVNGKPVADTQQRDPAEVRDEADGGANPAAPAATPAQQPRRQQQARRRHPAWQDPNTPMAPRPLHGEPGPAAQGVPVPPPAAAPRPVVPSSSAVIGCVGGTCTDTSGNSAHPVVGGNTGVNSSGRLCTQTGATVQCF